jgi:RNA polymerase sigma factor (sigma-70 family)
MPTLRPCTDSERELILASEGNHGVWNPRIRPCTSAERDRAAANVGLVGSRVPRSLIGTPDWDDAFQDGVIGLISAVQSPTYDPARAKFSTYATWLIWKGMSDAHRKRTSKLETVPRDFQDEENNHAGLHPEVPTEEYTEHDQQAVVAIFRRAGLTTREKIIVLGHIVFDETLTDLAKRLSISRERARQLKEQGLTKLRRAARVES